MAIKPRTQPPAQFTVEYRFKGQSKWHFEAAFEHERHARDWCEQRQAKSKHVREYSVVSRATDKVQALSTKTCVKLEAEDNNEYTALVEANRRAQALVVERREAALAKEKEDKSVSRINDNTSLAEFEQTIREYADRIMDIAYKHHGDYEGFDY